MPLDGSLFLQGAQMRMQDRNAAIDRVQRAIEFESQNKNKGLDLENLANQALYKINTTGQASPEDMAVLKTWDDFNRTKVRLDPLGNPTPVSRSIFDLIGQQGPTQYQPLYPPVTQSMPIDESGAFNAPPIQMDGIIPPPNLNKFSPPPLSMNGVVLPPMAQENIDRVNSPAKPLPEIVAPDASPFSQQQKIMADVALQKEAGLERVKEDIKQEQGAKRDVQSLSILNRMLERNKNTLDLPYQDTFLTRPLVRAATQAGIVSEKSNTAADLLRQDRLDLAAPLAKELGVNPTDKDFQASLDRIFDLNSTKESRKKQIENMIKKVKEKRGIESYTQENPVDYKAKYGLD